MWSIYSGFDVTRSCKRGSFKGKRENRFPHKAKNKCTKRDQSSPRGEMRKGFTGTKDTAGGTVGDTTGVSTQGNGGWVVF